MKILAEYLSLDQGGEIVNKMFFEDFKPRIPSCKTILSESSEQDLYKRIGGMFSYCYLCGLECKMDSPIEANRISSIMISENRLSDCVQYPA